MHLNFRKQVTFFMKGNYSAACRIHGKTIKFCKMQNVLPYKEIVKHSALCNFLIW